MFCLTFRLCIPCNLCWQSTAFARIACKQFIASLCIQQGHRTSRASVEMMTMMMLHAAPCCSLLLCLRCSGRLLQQTVTPVSIVLSTLRWRRHKCQANESINCARKKLRLICFALQAFPLAVKLHLTNLNLVLTFSYLPALNTVTAEADHKAGNELLASLFKDDTGQDTPNTATHSVGDGSFVFDPKATARPYRCISKPIVLLSSNFTA